MSTAALPLRRAATSATAVRSGLNHRQPSREQGIALEILGHAIEYLADTSETIPYGRDCGDAIDLLASRSRAVFHECVEIIPLRKKIVDRASAAWGLLA